MRVAAPVVVVACLVSVPLAAGAQKAEKGPVYEPGNGVSAPILVKEVKPQYTADAMRAKIEGVVKVRCVVETDGSTGDVEVTQPLDPGLDQEAVKAVRQWRFKPGTKDGKPVRVRVTLELTFTLRK
jgi:TonB family protein